MITLDSSVKELNGVGTARLKQLQKLGIESVRDLIYAFPRAYENRNDVHSISTLDDEAPHAYILTVASEVKNALIRKNLTLSKFRAFDGSGSCEIVFFNSPYIKNVFHIGDEFRFYGKLNINNKKIQLTNPKYEKLEFEKALPAFYPIYPLTEGISTKVFAKLTEAALNAAALDINEHLPDELRLKNSLPTLSFALRNIHAPESDEALSAAMKRLSFDEMFFFGLGISLSLQYKNAIPGVRFMPCDMSEFTKLLPYELTDSQKNVINDIYSDTVIKTKNPENGHMARIVVGDVGSGKTVCAAAAAFLAVKSGYQCALMAPTEILARQHYKELKPMFEALGFEAVILLGALTQKEKNTAYEKIQNGKASLVIGTHAILSEKVNFQNLGLIITDEQHRFGVAQRAHLNEKNTSAHILVMSATPIPRTLALAMYGDLDVSRITELPRGRQAIDTYVVGEAYRERINKFIASQIANSGQCYIVCPAIDESNDEDFEETNIKNVLNYADKLKQTLPFLKIGVLHGKLKSKEKDAVMSLFSKGEIQVLISTTVVEVGVNVPNANLMIIENADRFGLSQLHQLRGRVGRGTRKSYCVLVSDLNTEKAKARLEIMKSTNDGFEIANKDLALRGPGDFFLSKDSGALRQSGGFEFKLASLCNDSNLFSAAFSAAKEIAAEDPQLSLPKHELIKNEISKYISPMASATLS